MTFPDSFTFGGKTYVPADVPILPGAICRMKNDTELPDWHFLSRSDPDNPRFTGLDWSPHTMRLNGGSSAIRLPPAWQDLFHALNTPRAAKYAKRGGSGWVNKPSWPTIQELSFAAPFNLVLVTAVDGEKVYIRTMDIRKPPPRPQDVDPFTVHDFTVIDPAGAVLRPDPPGVPAKILIVSDAPLWIERRKLAVVQNPI